jgi:hypothetical protein
MVATRNCQQCEVMYINGIRCHERGCPLAWADQAKLCKWCGQEFRPEERYQVFCDESCAESYNS